MDLSIEDNSFHGITGKYHGIVYHGIIDENVELVVRSNEAPIIDEHHDDLNIDDVNIIMVAHKIQIEMIVFMMIVATNNIFITTILNYRKIETLEKITMMILE